MCSRERECAARLIQFAWRQYAHEQELAEKLEVANPRLYAEIVDQEDRQFVEVILPRGLSYEGGIMSGFPVYYYYIDAGFSGSFERAA